MPLSQAIPLTTLDPAHGPYDFGPYTVKQQDSQALLSIDRTVAGGLNVTPAADISIAVNDSPDGGVSWALLAAAGIPGGQFTSIDKTTGLPVPVNRSSVGVGLDLVTGLRLKATITVNTVVAVAGSFTVT